MNLIGQYCVGWPTMATRTLRIGWLSWPQSVAILRSCGAVDRGDLEELRRLVDSGNENAADRLAELAAERGDLEELRRLVDEGNENAAERLTELAAERGDLEELQRLSDEGYENAADRLSELIRNIK